MAVTLTQRTSKQKVGTGINTASGHRLLAVAMKKSAHMRMQLEANGTVEATDCFLAAGLSSSSHHCHWTGPSRYRHQ